MLGHSQPRIELDNERATIVRTRTVRITPRPKKEPRIFVRRTNHVNLIGTPLRRQAKCARRHETTAVGTEALWYSSTRFCEGTWTADERPIDSAGAGCAVADGRRNLSLRGCERRRDVCTTVAVRRQRRTDQDHVGCEDRG